MTRGILLLMSFFTKKQSTVSLGTDSIVRIMVTVLLFIVVIRFLSSITHQLTLIGVAGFLALALNPAVSRLTRMFKSKSRVRATGVAYIVVLSTLSAFLYLVVPPLVSQTSEFVRELPRTIQDFQQQDSLVGQFVRNTEIDENLQEWSDDLESRAGDLAEPILSTAGRAAGTAVSIITVLVLTFMMLVEGPMWLDRLIALQPESKRQKRREIIHRMYRVVTGYVNGQVIIAAISAMFAMVALLIGNLVFDASVNAVALAGITFIFALIPLIGNIIGAIIVMLMCLFVSPPFALAIGVYFLIYQQIENATIQPYIQSRGNQLTALSIFIAALIGAGAGGLLGALAAIPLAGCLRIILEERWGIMLPGSDALEQPEKSSN